MWEAAITIIKQLFLKPATNLFPAKYAPESTLDLLAKVAKQQVALNPPVAVPPQFRGKIAYDRENCTGCQQCVKICPTRAIEFLPEERKIKIFVSRCCFCAQCVDVCPVHTLAMTEEFLLSSYDKFADALVVTDSGELPGSVKRKAKSAGAGTSSEAEQAGA
ncbi:MAG: 4Fe-4S dicluster domain-containing protein [Chloroflexi bacterium]|nr:4Fe-4S dicluster domain-containing protein [Chloroflexota bacterium]